MTDTTVLLSTICDDWLKKLTLESHVLVIEVPYIEAEVTISYELGEVLRKALDIFSHPPFAVKDSVIRLQRESDDERLIITTIIEPPVGQELEWEMVSDEFAEVNRLVNTVGKLSVQFVDEGIRYKVTAPLHRS